MKITNQQLRQIIKEELQKVLNEGRRDISGVHDPRQIAKYAPGKYVYRYDNLIDAVDQDPNTPQDMKEKLKMLLNSDDEESVQQAIMLMDTLDIQNPLFSSDDPPFAPGRDPFDDLPYIHRIHMSPTEKERYETYELMGQRGQDIIRDQEMMRRYVGKKGPKKQFHPELDPTHPSRKFGRFELDPSEVPRITDEQIEQMKKERLKKSVRKDMDYDKRLKK